MNKTIENENERKIPKLYYSSYFLDLSSRSLNDILISLPLGSIHQKAGMSVDLSPVYTRNDIWEKKAQHLKGKKYT